jgi:hypothetical protein
MVDWDAALTDWLKPFVEKLGHKKRQQMCPLYVAGLIGTRRTQKHRADGDAHSA